MLQCCPQYPVILSYRRYPAKRALPAMLPHDPTAPPNILHTQLIQDEWHTFACPLFGTKTEPLLAYHRNSNISHTKSQNLNVSCLILQLSSPNTLKPSVTLRMTIYLEQCWQEMVQLRLTDQQLCYLLRYGLYQRFDGIVNWTVDHTFQWNLNQNAFIFIFIWEN